MRNRRACIVGDTGLGSSSLSGVVLAMDINAATNIAKNTMPNANAQVSDNEGMYSMETNKPMMLATKNPVFSGAILMWFTSCK
jgi:hypothetical protein